MASANNPSLQIDDPAEFPMPFGKHAGVPVSEVPPQYLRWAYYDCNFTYYPELQRAIEQCLGIPPDPGIRTGAGQYAKYLNGGTTERFRNNSSLRRPVRPPQRRTV